MDLRPGPIQTHLEVSYDAAVLLLYRPFLQLLLNRIDSSGADINSISPNITCRAQKAIDISVKLIGVAQTRPRIDWFSLKSVIMGALLILSASSIMGDDALSTEQVEHTLFEAIEVLSKAAKGSEAAKRAYQLVSEVKARLKVESSTSN